MVDLETNTIRDLFQAQVQRVTMGTRTPQLNLKRWTL